jgi:hypothetical protein
MTHSMATRFSTACGIAALVLCIHATSTARIEENAWLITPEEAAMAPSPGAGKGDIAVGGDADLGPSIHVVKPINGGSAPPPVEVDIKFSPKLSPVDLASLKVSVVKFINIDITDRVREYASAKGILVPAANIPQGKYTVRVSVADKDGLRSYKDVTFEVL